jgi:hypothetical protein
MLVVGTSVTSVIGISIANRANAAACGGEPASTTGKVTQTVDIPTSGNYTIWSRLKAPDTNIAGYTFFTDDGQCFSIGGRSLEADTFTWVNYENGSTSDIADMTLSAGNHTIIMTAGTDNLALDRVMLLSDACVPTGNGDNCNSDTTNPTVSLTAPSNGATVAGNVGLSANASDNDAVDYVEFYRGVTLLGSDNTAPYSYSWDSTGVTDGSYSLTARAYDKSNNTQTSTAVNVTVHNTPAPVDAAITSFSATDTSIVEGNSTTLNWSVASAQSCSLDQGIGTVGLSGSRSVSPITNTTYTLTCNGLNGGSNDSSQVSITVTPAPQAAQIASFAASPASIVEGGSSTLSWTATVGTGCSINQGVGSVGLTGSRSVSPSVTTTYTLTCLGSNGGASSSRQATVTVNPAPVTAAITSFSATPASIHLSENATLNWSVQTGQNCSINQGIGSVGLSGSRQVTPSANTSYTLTCQGLHGGANATASAQVTVLPPLDTDNDGVPDYIETAGPNGGDTNGDSILDAEQPGVVSLRNQKTNTYNTLVATGDCAEFRATEHQLSSLPDAAFGAWKFGLHCSSPGDRATVTLYLDKAYETDKWRVVKVSSDGSTKQDISSQVTLSTKMLGAKSVTALAYTIVDGGDLDDDGTADGEIVDPLAIETPVVTAAASGEGETLADTGMNATQYIYAGCVMLLAGIGGVINFRKISIRR